MNESMTGEIVLMDDEVKSTLESLDTPSNEIAISQMLDKAKSYLEVAMRQADAPRAIADFKAEIIAVAQYAKQKKVSEEIQIDATAMVRRAERSLGVAIREGQEQGVISSRANPNKAGGAQSSLPSPYDFASKDELTGGNRARIYHMTDNVTDQEFDEALEIAKEERNLSRANIVRKIREGKTESEEMPSTKKAHNRLPDEVCERVRELAAKMLSSQDISEQTGVSQRSINRILAGTIERTSERTIKGNNTQKIMGRLTESLWGMRQSLQTITAVDSNLNPDQVAAWSKELRQTSAELNRIKNLLKESK